MARTNRSELTHSCVLKKPKTFQTIRDSIKYKDEVIDELSSNFLKNRDVQKLKNTPTSWDDVVVSSLKESKYSKPKRK